MSAWPTAFSPKDLQKYISLRNSPDWEFFCVCLSKSVFILPSFAKLLNIFAGYKMES